MTSKQATICIRLFRRNGGLRQLRMDLDGFMDLTRAATTLPAAGAGAFVPLVRTAPLILLLDDIFCTGFHQVQRHSTPLMAHTATNYCVINQSTSISDFECSIQKAVVTNTWWNHWLWCVLPCLQYFKNCLSTCKEETGLYFSTCVPSSYVACY